VSDTSCDEEDDGMNVQDIDLTDVDMFLRGEQYDAWRTLRREAPVHWNDRSWGPGFWNITKYDDIIHVGIDPMTFISGEGILLDNTGERTRRMQMLRESGQSVFEPEGNMMIMTDPPRHTLLRRMVNKAFTHTAVRRMEPHIRALSNKIIDDIAERGECDFVWDVARLLPLEVICEMVGVPEGDWEGMFELTNNILGFDDPEFAPESTDLSPEDMQMAFDLFQYVADQSADRRKNPRDDVLTVLVNGDVDGERLRDDEIFNFFLLLILAGNETTRQATSGGMLALIENPDQRQKLIDDPTIVPLAIEEIVRWVSPVTHFVRTATRDTEIRGQKIAKGDYVVLWYPSGNRDEDVFGDGGERFVVDRSPNDHIAFGKGEHFCLGANLARLELRVMYEELLKRIPYMELAAPPERLRSNFITGIKRMPVRFKPTSKAAAA
jgi:cytochrome P450